MSCGAQAVREQAMNAYGEILTIGSMVRNVDRGFHGRNYNLGKVGKVIGFDPQPTASGKFIHVKYDVGRYGLGGIKSYKLVHPLSGSGGGSIATSENYSGIATYTHKGSDTATITIKKTTKLPMNSLARKVKQLFTAEPQKSFQKTGITDEDGSLTESGSIVFLDWLLSKNQDAFNTDIVQPLLKMKNETKDEPSW